MRNASSDKNKSGGLFVVGISALRVAEGAEAPIAREEVEERTDDSTEVVVVAVEESEMRVLKDVQISASIQRANSSEDTVGGSCEAGDGSFSSVCMYLSLVSLLSSSSSSFWSERD